MLLSPISLLEAAQECPWDQGGDISVTEYCWAPPLSSPGQPAGGW